MKDLDPQMNQSIRRAWFMLAAAILFILIIRGITFLEPPARDQSTYLTIAGELKEGATLYREIWGQRPPLTYFIYELITVMPGGWKWAGPGLDTLCHLLSVLFLFALMRRLYGGTVAGMAALLYAFYSSGQCYGGWWAKLHSEVILSPLIASAAYLTLMASGPGRRPRLVRMGFGILAALGVSVKPNCALIFGALALYILIQSWHSDGLIRCFKGALEILAGTIICLLPQIIYLAVNQALGDAWDAIFVFNVHYIAGIRPSLIKMGGDALHYMRAMFKLLEPIPLMMATPIALGYALLRIRRNCAKEVILPLWFAGASAMFISGRWFFFYHSLVMILPSTALVARGSVDVWRGLNGSKRLRAFLAVVVIALVMVAFGNGNKEVITQNLEYLRGKINQKTFYSSYPVFARVLDLSIHIKQANLIQSGDAIHVWGHDPLIYTLTGTRPATRFIINTPLHSKGFALQKNFREAFMADIASNPPKAIVIIKGRHKFRDPQDDAEKFRKFDVFYRLVQERYQLAYFDPYFDVYVLRDGSARFAHPEGPH